MFGLQPLHILIILALALVIFGPARLPEVSRTAGRTINEFRDSILGVEKDVRGSLDLLSEPKPDDKDGPPAPRA